MHIDVFIVTYSSLICGEGSLVGLCMQDYKPAAVTICATLVNMQTDTHATHRQRRHQAAGIGYGGLAAETRRLIFSPFRETYWLRIRRWIVRHCQILIVFAVKIGKQCLQTASASGRLRPSDPLPGLRSCTTMDWTTSVSRPTTAHTNTQTASILISFIWKAKPSWARMCKLFCVLGRLVGVYGGSSHAVCTVVVPTAFLSARRLSTGPQCLQRD